MLLSGVFIQEFEESGDPEKHFQALLLLAKQGIEKGKVGFIVSIIDNIREGFVSVCIVCYSF